MPAYRGHNYTADVVRGSVSGTSAITKFGKNTDIDTGSVPKDVWLGGGAYTGFPTGSPETVEIFSDDANDTSAGTGARTVRITGLQTSSSTAYTTEDLTLNGVTGVTSSNSYYRVNRAFILTAGSGGTNAGQLTVRHTSTTANVFSQISAGTGQTQICCWTVPASREFFMTRLLIVGTRDTGGAGTVNLDIQIREFETGAWRNIRDFTFTTGSALDPAFDYPLHIPAQADIRFRVQSVSANNTTVNALFSGVYME